MSGPVAKKVSCRVCGKELWRKFPRKSGSVCKLCHDRVYKFKQAKVKLPAVFRKEGEPEVHRVRCRDCGKEIERRAYWRKPSCGPCSQKRGKEVYKERARRRTWEARWFRIIFQESGYDTPEQLRDAVKVRNPKTWQFHYDTTLQRQANGD